MLEILPWINLWKERMLESGEFDPRFIKIFAEGAINDRLQEISPNESADNYIEIWRYDDHVTENWG
jgi:hypothetical protein